MENDFLLNVILKQDNIDFIDDVSLSKKELDKFFYNSEISKKGKLVFSKKNVNNKIRKNFIYAGILMLLLPLIMILMESLNTGRIAIPIIIGASFLIFGLVLSPFTTHKNLSLEIDESGQKRVRLKNVFGPISTILILENMQLIKDKKNSYFLLTEQDDGEVYEKYIIFAIESENINLIFETKKMLSDFFEQEITDIEIP